MAANARHYETLRALYTRSTDPSPAPTERDMAARALDARLTNLGLTLEDLLETEARKMCWFRYSNEHERTLLFQVYAAVCADHEVHYRSGKKKIIGLMLTVAESRDFCLMWDFYRELWATEVEALLEAFIQKHRLYDPAPCNEPSQGITLQELEDMVRRMDALRDADDPRKRRQLSSGEETR